jgi:hypothetical protein
VEGSYGVDLSSSNRSSIPHSGFHHQGRYHHPEGEEEAAVEEVEEEAVVEVVEVVEADLSYKCLSTDLG